MKKTTINFLRDLRGNQFTLMIYYKEGRTFTDEALLKFLMGMGYDFMSFNYNDGYSQPEDAYAPWHLDEYEICVVEAGVNIHTIRFCPDYFLLEPEVK